MTYEVRATEKVLKLSGCRVEVKVCQDDRDHWFGTRVPEPAFPVHASVGVIVETQWHTALRGSRTGPNNDVFIEVIQAGINPDRRGEGFDPIPERQSAANVSFRDLAEGMRKNEADKRAMEAFEPREIGCHPRDRVPLLRAV